MTEGVGAAPVGVGCDSETEAEVRSYLRNGSPRLALATAKCIPFAPYIMTIEASFPTTAVTSVPDVGADQKIAQDTEVVEMVVQVQNGNTAASLLQNQSDYYFNYQSGILATLDVQGAPRYSVCPSFTPLKGIADLIGQGGPGGGMVFSRKRWILTYQQQFFMSFNATVTLPVAPIVVTCIFRGWLPTWDQYDLTNAEAISQLTAMGFDCSSYKPTGCR